MARTRVFRHIQASLGDFLKNLAQKRVGVRPLRPSLDPRLSRPIEQVSSSYIISMLYKNIGINNH